MPKRGEKTRGVVLILGEDRFLAGEAVRNAIEGREAARYRGNEVKLGAALDEVRTLDFFGGGRSVALEEADPLLDADGLDALADYAEKPVPDSLLVVQAKKIDGRRAGAKRLKAAARVVQVAAPPEWELAQWVVGRARQAHGLQAGRDAAQELVERLGADLGALDRALGRLRVQVAPRDRLTAADVAESTEDHRSPTLFEATNALEARRLKDALAAVDAAFKEGLRMRADVVTEETGVALILLGQLHSAYRKLVRFHMLRRDASDEEAIRAVGVSPRAARFFIQRASAHRLDQLLERHALFVSADKSLKRGGQSPRQTLERLLVGLLA
ncbi:MAG: DNA polymerase III subunit delta [Planctomycetota bacterium]